MMNQVLGDNKSLLSLQQGRGEENYRCFETQLGKGKTKKQPEATHCPTTRLRV
jgi:hypothetical protein